MTPIAFVLGVAASFAGRALLPRVLMLRFAGDIAKLNAGDHKSLLDAYSEDFVLHFNQGPHRFSGDWIGKAAMDRFLQNFTAARLQGELRQLATSGPIWALTIWVRFDDYADGPDGTRIYENSTVLVLRTRRGKVVEQHDFYVDTARIAAFENELSQLGVQAVPRP
jgi:ketosteroid isomerase-like protein